MGLDIGVGVGEREKEENIVVICKFDGCLFCVTRSLTHFGQRETNESFLFHIYL